MERRLGISTQQQQSDLDRTFTIATGVILPQSALQNYPSYISSNSSSSSDSSSTSSSSSSSSTTTSSTSSQESEVYLTVSDGTVVSNLTTFESGDNKWNKPQKPETIDTTESVTQSNSSDEDIFMMEVRDDRNDDLVRRQLPITKANKDDESETDGRIIPETMKVSAEALDRIPVTEEGTTAQLETKQKLVRFQAVNTNQSSPTDTDLLNLKNDSRRKSLSDLGIVHHAPVVRPDTGKGTKTPTSSFNFETQQRSFDHEDGKSSTKNEELANRSNQFHHKPAPNFTATQPSIRDKPAQITTTEVKPFHFRTDKRAERNKKDFTTPENEKNTKRRSFANPVPDFDAAHKSIKDKPSPRKPVTPCPFSFATDRRAQARNVRSDVSDDGSSNSVKMRFRANPVPDFDAAHNSIKDRPSKKKAMAAHPFHFATEERAAGRQGTITDLEFYPERQRLRANPVPDFDVAHNAIRDRPSQKKSMEPCTLQFASAKRAAERLRHSEDRQSGFQSSPASIPLGSEPFSVSLKQSQFYNDAEAFPNIYYDAVEEEKYSEEVQDRRMQVLLNEDGYAVFRDCVDDRLISSPAIGKHPGSSVTTEPGNFRVETLDKDLYRNSTKPKPLKVNVTEPRPFNFSTEKRSSEKAAMNPEKWNEADISYHCQSTLAAHSRGSDMKAVRLFTQPKPFRFVTDERASKKQSSNHLIHGISIEDSDDQLGYQHHLRPVPLPTLEEEHDFDVCTVRSAASAYTADYSVSSRKSTATAKSMRSAATAKSMRSAASVRPNAEKNRRKSDSFTSNVPTRMNAQPHVTIPSPFSFMTDTRAARRAKATLEKDVENNSAIHAKKSVGNHLQPPSYHERKEKTTRHENQHLKGSIRSPLRSTSSTHERKVCSAKPRVTEPQPFHFHIDHRLEQTSRKGVLRSAEELELEECKHKFQALPLPKQDLSASKCPLVRPTLKYLENQPLKLNADDSGSVTSRRGHDSHATGSVASTGSSTAKASSPHPALHLMRVHEYHEIVKNPQDAVVHAVRPNDVVECAPPIALDPLLLHPDDPLLLHPELSFHQLNQEWTKIKMAHHTGDTLNNSL